jgi:hypothetical protein
MVHHVTRIHSAEIVTDEMHSEKRYWMLEVEVNDDETPDPPSRRAHVFPLGTVEWRMGEYGLTEDEALEVILHEPFIEGDAPLYTAENREEARALHLEKIHHCSRRPGKNARSKKKDKPDYTDPDGHLARVKASVVRENADVCGEYADALRDVVKKRPGGRKRLDRAEKRIKELG